MQFESWFLSVAFPGPGNNIFISTFGPDQISFQLFYSWITAFYWNYGKTSFERALCFTGCYGVILIYVCFDDTLWHTSFTGNFECKIRCPLERSFTVLHNKQRNLIYPIKTSHKDTLLNTRVKFEVLWNSSKHDLLMLRIA